MNSTSSVSEVIHNTNPIGLNKYIKPNRNPIGLHHTVDLLLQDYSDLIEPRYTAWFAKHFYTLGFDKIHRAASEARSDGKNPQRLFVHLIKKLGV